MKPFPKLNPTHRKRIRIAAAGTLVPALLFALTLKYAPLGTIAGLPRNEVAKAVLEERAATAPLKVVATLPDNAETRAVLEERTASAPITAVEKLPDTPLSQAVLEARVKAAPQKELVKLPASPAVKVALSQTNRMRRPYGMPPSMFEAYIAACEKAKVSPPKILQTIGSAPASAGSHTKDGVVSEGGTKYDYTTCVDARSRTFPNDAARQRFLSALADEDFAAWYRKEPQFPNNRHFHMVSARYRMKPMTRRQVQDFVNGRTGLVGHARETFWQPSAKQKQSIRAQFLKHNPAKG